jgi:hypothetical protein
MQTESTDTNKLTHSLTAQYWENLPERPAILGLGLLLVYFCFGMAHWGWVPILDSATLAIHEAGHPIIGMLFGERMMVYGGSMFQLIFPAVFAWHFARHDQALGYCFALAWEATSLHNLGRYIADARAQELPLAGNGDRIHDWNEILGRWNLLKWDHLLGGSLSAAGWLLIACCFLMLFSLWKVRSAA